jgi:hypothetical protein
MFFGYSLGAIVQNKRGEVSAHVDGSGKQAVNKKT